MLIVLAMLPWLCLEGGRPVEAAEVLTNQNVIAMVRAGLPESLIISKIQSTDAKFDLSANGLIALKQGGVSDTVMLAMMNRASGAASAPPAAPPQAASQPTAPPPMAAAPPPPPPAAPGMPPPPPAYSSPPPPAAPGAPGCPQLSQPDPYQDLRGALAQLRSQGGGAPNQGQVQPLVAQVQSTLDARDAALRQGACDTSQYDQQIGTMIATLQNALNAPAQGAPPPPPGYQAGASQPPPGYPQPGSPPPPPGYPQQAGAPPGYPPPASGAAPGAPGSQGQMPSAGEIFSKLFDIAIDKFAGKSKKGGDSGSGFTSANAPPPSYSDPSASQQGYPAPPPAYTQPPPAYTQPPSAYTPPPPSYAPPPPGYAQPPPTSTPSSGYTPPPSGYTPPPPAYTPPPSYPPATGSASPPPSYTPPGYTPPPSAPGVVSPSVVQKSLVLPQSAVVPRLALPAPDLQGLVSLRGIVRGDAGAALAGATVTVVEWNKIAMTGSDGSYAIQGPAGQRLTIQVQAYGYNGQTSVTAAAAGTVTTQDFALVWARRPIGTIGR